MWKHVFISVAFLLASQNFAIASYLGEAQPRANTPVNPKPAYSVRSSRYLSGHHFLMSALVPTAFSAPYVRSSLEGAFATIHVNGMESDIKAAGLTPSFTGQFRVGDIGFEFGIDASEIFGADGYSALVLGANYSYGISGTIRIPVLKEDWLALTPTIGIRSQSGGSFSPLNAVAQSIMTKAEAADFLSSTSTFQLKPGLLAAAALSPTFGISAELSRVFSNTTSSDLPKIDDGSIRAGIALSTNFQPELGLPIGFLAAYRNDWPIRPDIENTSIYELGIFEMLNQDFNFGIEMTRLVTSTPSISFLLSLTYYYR